MPRHLTLYYDLPAGLWGIDDETVRYPLVLKPLDLLDYHMREEGLTRLIDKYPDVFCIYIVCQSWTWKTCTSSKGEGRDDASFRHAHPILLQAERVRQETAKSH